MERDSSGEKGVVGRDVMLAVLRVRMESGGRVSVRRRVRTLRGGGIAMSELEVRGRGRGPAGWVRGAGR